MDTNQIVFAQALDKLDAVMSEEALGDEPLPPKTSFYYLSNLFLALLCALTFAVMIVLTVRVSKKVWDQDRVVPFMLIFLDLSLVGSTMFFSWSLIRVYSYPLPEDSYTFICEETIYPYLPVTFLTCAVLLNMNKWIYCLMHINFYGKAHSNVNSSMEEFGPQMIQQNLLKLTVKQQMLNFATIGVVVLYLFYNFSYFLYGCVYHFESQEKYHDRVYKKLEVFTQWTFMTLAFLFIVLGIVLLTKLKRHFPKFYSEHRCLMITATVFLTVPLTFRAVFDTIKVISPDFMAWVDLNYTRNAIYNFFFFLLTTYMPIIGQIMSLVFGFVRHKQERKKRHKKKKAKPSEVAQYEQQTKALLTNGILEDQMVSDEAGGAGGSDYGDENDDDEDDETASGRDFSSNTRSQYSQNNNSRYFDPPIENYRFIEVRN